MDYIHGTMYIGNVNTRVREHNLRGSENEWIVRDKMSIIGWCVH